MYCPGLFSLPCYRDAGFHFLPLIGRRAEGRTFVHNLQLMTGFAPLLSLPREVMKPRGQIKQAVPMPQKLLLCRTRCNTS